MNFIGNANHSKTNTRRRMPTISFMIGPNNAHSFQSDLCIDAGSELLSCIHSKWERTVTS